MEHNYVLELPTLILDTEAGKHLVNSWYRSIWDLETSLKFGCWMLYIRQHRERKTQSEVIALFSDDCFTPRQECITYQWKEVVQ